MAAISLMYGGKLPSSVFRRIFFLTASHCGKAPCTTRHGDSHHHTSVFEQDIDQEFTLDYL